MQRIYLLLRNNAQSGPFTIEELLEQELLPSDLIWVEGKSLAWSYASELNLLRLARHGSEPAHRPASAPTHSSVHSVPPAKRKRPRLKRSEIVPPAPAPEPMPKPQAPLTPAPMSSAFSAGDVERKAEELRQRALEAERTYHTHQPVPAYTRFTPDPTGDAGSDIEVVYHKKGLHIPFPQVLVGGVVVAMLVAGWYGQPLFRQKKDTVDATATPLVSTQSHSAAAPYKSEPVPAVVVDTTSGKDSTQSAATQASLAVYTPGSSSQAHNPEPASIKDSPTVKPPEAAAAERPPVEQKKSEPEETVKKEPEKSNPAVTTPKKESVQAEPAATASEDTREHKRGFLKGLFRKKKNRDNEPAEESGAVKGENQQQSQEN